jgi:HD superfamily phosphohydrolase
MKNFFGRVLPSDEYLKEVGAAELRRLQLRLQEVEKELETLKACPPGSLKGYIKLLIGVWTEPHGSAGKRKFLDDPVFQHLCLDEELGPLTAHPLLSRLNHIKQLSFAYLTYPSATHTRLAHSLGACKKMEVALDTVFRNNLLYSASGASPISLAPEGRRRLLIKAKAAALLHDVGHGPFGHALDRYIGFLDPKRPVVHPDKYFSKRYIQTYLSDAIGKCEIDSTNMATILSRDKTSLMGWDCLIADLVDSSLDVDRMDYLTRDAHMTGLSMGITCVGAILEKICPFLVPEEDALSYGSQQLPPKEQVVLTYHKSCLPYVEDFLAARETMFLTCYDDPQKLAAERIFTRLVDGLMTNYDLTPDEIMLLTDEQILTLLMIASGGVGHAGELLRVLLTNLPYEQLEEVALTEKTVPIESWRVLQNGGQGKQAYIDQPAMWERAIVEQAGMDNRRSWQLLVVVPPHEAHKPLEGGTRILFKEGAGYSVKKLFDVLPNLESRLTAFIAQREKIRVFCDARLSEQERSDLRRAVNVVLRPTD